uniref:Uncharacterized protein n=1 Tax=Anguilla anguilla TaxID=7936 RepID=A0A0E9PAT9_ANGAN
MHTSNIYLIYVFQDCSASGNVNSNVNIQNLCICPMSGSNSNFINTK